MEKELMEDNKEISNCMPDEDTWHGGESGYELNKELIKEQYEIRKALILSEPKQYDTNEALKNVRNKIRKADRYPTLKNRMRLIAAACIIICFGIAFLLSNSRNYTRKGIFVESQSVAVNKYPELITPSGEKVILNEMSFAQNIGDDVVIENDSLNKVLKFNSSGKGVRTDELNILRIPKGCEYSVVLPDGTKVWVNSETTLKFPVEFEENSRKVYLDGEALFDVTKNEKAPFEVFAGKHKVTVLGTTFNLSAYHNDRKWSATLVTGSIVVNEKVKINPSQQVVYDNINELVEIKTVNTELFTSWVDGKYYFSEETFEDIVLKLERWYDFDIVYHDEQIKKMRFSGTINKYRSVGDMLKILEKTTNVKFEINDNLITASLN